MPTVSAHRFAAPTATGNTDITTTKLGGLTPKAVVLKWTNATVDGTITTHAVLGFGATDGTRSFNNHSWEQSGQASQNSGRDGDTTNCVSIRTGAGSTTADSEAVFVSFITNGVRLNFTTANTAYLITAEFYAGSDLSAYVGTFALGAASGSLAKTGVGFQPKMLHGFSHGDDYAAAAQPFYNQSHGYAFDNGSTVEQAGFAGAADDAVPTTEAHHYLFDGAWLGQTSAAGSLTYSLTVTSMDADGFTITRSASPGSDDIGFLALDFTGDAHVSVNNSPTATGNWTVTTGHEPQFACISGGMAQTVNTIISSGDAGSLFLSSFDDTDEYTNSVAWAAAAADSDSQSLSDNVHARVYNHTGGTQEFLTDETGSPFTATGLEVSFSSVNATARKWVVYSIEAEVGGATISNIAGSGGLAGYGSLIVGPGGLAG